LGDNICGGYSAFCEPLVVQDPFRGFYIGLGTSFLVLDLIGMVGSSAREKVSMCHSGISGKEICVAHTHLFTLPKWAIFADTVGIRVAVATFGLMW